MRGRSKARRTAPAILVLVGLAIGAGLPARAAAQDVSGAWAVRWAQAIRVNRDGSVEIQRWGDAELALTQEGERVHGTWTTNVVERVTWTVEGSFRDGRLELRGIEHDSDNPELDTVEGIAWEATLAGGHLEGNVAISFRGMRRAPAPHAFSATRTTGA